MTFDRGNPVIFLSMAMLKFSVDLSGRCETSGAKINNQD